MTFGIQALEIYIPKTFVSQADLQKYSGVSAGKYTKGLGQQELSFCYPFEDINSISLTVVANLLKNYQIDPSQVGRLEVGTQTLVDKAKSTKTTLMRLFPNNHDIEGATSINACYGGTNALLNTLNWIGSPAWDGRYGIVVCADIAVYGEGPARPTGGAGAIAILIGPNPKISFNNIRASFIDDQYDFYKPMPQSEYPIVDGKVSMGCYINAMKECYKTLKQKNKGTNVLQRMDFFCFHTPFYKMIVKAFAELLKFQSPKITEAQILSQFQEHVEPTLSISKRVGNSYTGSLYFALYSLLIQNPQIKNKKVLLFSYGSGLCSSMLEIKIHSNPLPKNKAHELQHFFKQRSKISPQQFSQVMLYKEKTYGLFKGKVDVIPEYLNSNSFYLDSIDEKWRRIYKVKKGNVQELTKQAVRACERIESLNMKIPLGNDTSKFYKLSVPQRREIVKSRLSSNKKMNLFDHGGLTMEYADGMIENVIGKLSMPLAVIPMIPINHRKLMVPVSIEEPSVVAATSSIGKFISPQTFTTSSTPSMMIGQVHLPHAEFKQISQILAKKHQLIEQLNCQISSMVKRGGGVEDIRIREIGGEDLSHKQYSIDILVNVCDAMGANITNTIAEKAKELVSKMGVQTGIAILTNYCVQRKSQSQFVIPIEKMTWKGITGKEVAEKILEAYDFAKKDKHRATTHNKGIMNGIDAVCLATGQDWRAVEASAHSEASKTGKYLPLTHYQIIQKNGKEYFKGSIELPIAVGTVGGAIQKNPIYKITHEILGNPSSQELAEIMVTVGLAQNFGALRALAIEGIQKGHMKLHARSIASQFGVPNHLIDQCCKYLTFKKKYDEETVRQFLEFHGKSKL